MIKFFHHISDLIHIKGRFIGIRWFLFMLLIFNLLINSNLHAQQFKNETELRKEADRLFEEDEFTKAYSLYTQLVSLYPKDPELNYKLGVCMLYSESDKKKCFSYLKLAATHPKDAPKDAIFYYAKAFHMNYMFDEALNYYQEYKNIGSPAQQKRLQVDKEINACVNGKRLLATMSELIVLSKKQLNESDYFRSYDLSSVGGKLLVKPDQFRTNYDKKKKEKSVIYIPNSGDRIYFSSMGEKGETGRDIYYSTKVTADKFSKPVKLPVINTEFDEDYPFLHPDGKTLYFSSKGFNSMGGYDVFKSTYNEETNTWSPPVNMEFPINSPDDDYLFVTDSSEKFAYFSTGRQSPPGKIDVLKVKTERIPMTIAFIKGTVLKENAAQSLKSKITVKNMENGKVVGVFQAKDNGDYTMEVPNGGKLLYTVETPGIPIQSDKVILPMASSFSPFKQSISYDNKVLKIINYFDSPPDDNSYLQYLELIEKKAKLDVNENDIKTSTSSQPLANTEKDTKSVNTNNPTVTPLKTENKTNAENINITAANTTTGTAKTNFSNEQLVAIAKEDAGEAKTEAIKMTQDAADANELGEQKKIEADKLQKQSDEAFTYVNTLTDPLKKESAKEEAEKIKSKAEEASKVATTMVELAKSLESDAVTKQTEADLNEQYAKELGNLAKSKNNKDSQAKLDDLQKQIAVVSNQKKQSDVVYNKIKTEYDQKQNEINKAEDKANSLKNEISEINKEIGINETEINNSKDKSLKKSLTAQVEELKLDKNKKNSELTSVQENIEKLKNIAKASDTEMYLVNQIRSTDSKTAVAAIKNTVSPAVTTNTAPVITNTTSVTTNTTSIKTETSTPVILNENQLIRPSTELAKKYDEKLTPIKKSTAKEDLQSANTILSEYNKELTALIKQNINDVLEATLTENEKNILITEISRLQLQKSSNIQTISNNINKIREQGGITTANTNTQTSIASSVTPVATNTSRQNFTSFDGKNDLNKLTSLKTTVNTANNPAFAYNGYKEANSISLKKEAEDKLKIANATKGDLDKAIIIAEQGIKTNTSIAIDNNSAKDALNSEGDALSNKAKEARSASNSKSGKEKDKLLEEAKQYETNATKKYLQASDLAKKQNKSDYDINNQNITELVNQSMYLNKNSAENTSNLNEGQKLQQEANTYFKQATAIREEANNLGSEAAKLGTISNAEEKEAEALTKQKKAIDALLKSNPGYVVKTSSGPGVENPNATALNIVKQQFDKLNKEKLDAYITLSKANQNEYKVQNSKITTNPALKNNPEAITVKKQAENLNTQAVTLISKALTEKDLNVKQNLFLDANKKEVDALALLNQSNELLKSPIAVNNLNTQNEKPIIIKTKEPIVKNTEPIKSNTTAVTETKEPVVKNTEPIKSNTTTVTETKEPVVKNTEPVKSNTTAVTETKEPVVKNTEPVKSNTTTVTETKEPVVKNTETVATVNTKTTTPKTTNKPYVTTNSTTINPEYKFVKDESVKSIISYIDENPVPYKSAEATNLKSSSINNLIVLADEQSHLDEEINKLPGMQTGAEEIKSNITKLNTEADDYDSQASLKRKEATEKTGSEKEQLVKEITDLENKSYQVKTKASELQNQLNEANYKNNNSAIANYLEKAKAANAGELIRAQELISTITTAKTQAVNLRDEANSITNLSAKLGAFSNAEEKEIELLNKQSEVINLLRKYDLTYTQTPVVIASKSAENINPELKTKYDAVLQKQNTELENITKANVMEYETTYEQLPVILSDTQKESKAKAQNLITESKTLNDKANQTPDQKQKKELLSQASKKGQEAIVALNKTFDKGLVAKTNNKPVKEVKEKPVKEVKEKPVTETSEPVAAAKPKKTKPIKETKEPVATTNTTEPVNPPSGDNQVTLKVQGLEIKTGNVYTAANPIPLDAKIPDGLVFRVQVGAFKSPIPNNTFKGLTPVNAQTTPNGFLRYTVGNFDKFEDATGVKNDLRKMGYSDAFVVVFYNGQRVTVNEAINIAQKEGKEVIATNNQSAGIPTDANIAKNIAPAVPRSEFVVVTKELEKSNGLLFTVQIGVYSREITRSQLWKLEPIYTERLPSGLYRYTAGIYSDDIKVVTDKKKVVELGIKDAFVSAYYNGKRVPFTEGQKIKTENKELKMESENPIIFPSEQTPANSGPSPASTALTEPTPIVAPFKNNVTSAPAPTPENGVKLNDEGVTFKVQIGAYRNQVPQEIASKFLNIKTWPVDNKFVNGLYIYSVGSFSEAKFAKQLRDEVIALGVTDAFISVYQNGKKLYGQEATNYLNR